MNFLPLTEDRRVELFRSFTADALIYADEASWHHSFVVGQPSAWLNSSAPNLQPLLNKAAAQFVLLTTVSGFAVRLVFPAECEFRVFHDAVQFLLSALPQSPERPLLFAAQQGGQLFELQLLVQGDSA